MITTAVMDPLYTHKHTSLYTSAFFMRRKRERMRKTTKIANKMTRYTGHIEYSTSVAFMSAPGKRREK